ncbi:hypothetical protein OURE66S_02418 [Oligella ureolytica]
MIIHMVLFKFEEPVSADFEETVEYHCEQIRQHCEGVILFDLKKNSQIAQEVLFMHFPVSSKMLKA